MNIELMMKGVVLSLDILKHAMKNAMLIFFSLGKKKKNTTNKTCESIPLEKIKRLTRNPETFLSILLHK